MLGGFLQISPAAIQGSALGLPSGAGAAEYPVVIIPGWGGLGESVFKWWDAAAAAGFNVVDFRGAVAEGNTISSKAVTYYHVWSGHSYIGDFYEGIPVTNTQYFQQIEIDHKYQAIAGPNIGAQVIEGAGIRNIATQVWNTIQQKVYFEDGAVHYDAVSGKWHTPKIEVVTHSMGGLVLRSMIMMGYLNGKIDDAITIAAPHWGVPVANWATSTPGIVMDVLEEVIAAKSSSAWDMRVGSAFLGWLDSDSDGAQEVADLPAGAVNLFSCIAGDPWYTSWLPGNNMWADPYGLTGFDGLVPCDGALLVGSSTYTTPNNHASQLIGKATIDKIINILGRSSSYTGPNTVIVGDAFVKIAGFQPGECYDWWDLIAGGGDFYYNVWIDTVDGNGYQYVGQIDPGEDISPGAQRWYGGSYSTGMVHLPGNQPYLNVKVEVWDYDPICGFTSNPAMNCYQTSVYYEKMLVDNDNDGWPLGSGEIYSKTWAGRVYYEKYWCSGITNVNDGGTIYYYRYLLQNFYMLKTATLRIVVDPKEDDVTGEDDMAGYCEISVALSGVADGAWRGHWGTDFGDFRLWVYYQVTAL
jgi:hypothetical protein